jgi:hypothetical protein
VPEHQRYEMVEILVAGNNLLMSMLATEEVDDSILGYFIGNAEATHMAEKR